MRFSILSDPSNLKISRHHIKNYIQKNKLNTLDELNVVLAIDESVQNIIRHAYHMDSAKVIDFDLTHKELDFTVLIRDYGTQVSLEKIKSRDLKDIKPGGLGVHFIKSICKKVDYKHVVDTKGGTLLTLVF
jgi:anti-sigma regulatory factor (Ser/Thr protein kinase)